MGGLATGPPTPPTLGSAPGTPGRSSKPKSLLEVRGLGKRFEARGGRAEAFWAIRDLSFAVAEREFLTIVGPSGSGKSTLLNLLAQIDSPSEGEVRFRDRLIASPSAGGLRPGWDRQFGYVTQDDTLLPWRTLLENVLFPLRVQNRLSADMRERAAGLMHAVGLEGFERHYPHELSGGMRKRAALIRTLVYDPPVILMDEPFGALDAQTRTQLQEDLLRLWNLGRKTIVFVTHDIAEAIALGDRTLVFTRAPARVQSEHAIPLARPRDVASIYTVDGFADLHAAIRKELA
jgi:sulfonate transport system ATP-binding protein